VDTRIREKKDTWTGCLIVLLIVAFPITIFKIKDIVDDRHIKGHEAHLIEDLYSSEMGVRTDAIEFLFESRLLYGSLESLEKRYAEAPGMESTVLVHLDDDEFINRATAISIGALFQYPAVSAPQEMDRFVRDLTLCIDENGSCLPERQVDMEYGEFVVRAFNRHSTSDEVLNPVFGSIQRVMTDTENSDTLRMRKLLFLAMYIGYWWSEYERGFDHELDLGQLAKTIDRVDSVTAENVLSCLITDTAQCLDENGKWIHSKRRDGLSGYDTLCNLGYSLSPQYISSVGRKVLTPVSVGKYMPELRGRVLFLAVKLGIPKSEENLLSLLDSQGDAEMAEDFLNCGSPYLHAGAERWAERHGYSVKAGEGSHRSDWGQRGD